MVLARVARSVGRTGGTAPVRGVSGRLGVIAMLCSTAPVGRATRPNRRDCPGHTADSAEPLTRYGHDEARACGAALLGLAGRLRLVTAGGRARPATPAPRATAADHRSGSNARDLWIGSGEHAKGVPSRVIDRQVTELRPALQRGPGKHASAQRSQRRRFHRVRLFDRRDRSRGRSADARRCVGSRS